MRKILVLGLVLVLTGCNGSSVLKGTGEATEAPYGYTKLCKDHPELSACQ